MNCPNCNSPGLTTTETFQTAEETVRTKKCKACGWKFTSREVVSDELSIPRALRRNKANRPERRPGAMQEAPCAP